MDRTPTGRLTALLTALAFLLSAGCASSNKQTKTNPKTTSASTDVADEDIGPGEIRAQSEWILVRDPELDQALTVIDITEAEPNPELRMIFFPYDEATLGADDRARLQEASRWLIQHPTAEIVLEGHADRRGSNAYNLALGEQRAMAAHDYLVALGVDQQRLRVISYGEERPIDADADSPMEYARNRRVEMEPTEKTQGDLSMR